MPPVPPACQPLADEVAAFEAQEQQLRAQIPTLVGAAAWTALANLGQIRQQLDAARVALAECIHQNTAALQATLAVIDVGAASAAPVRIAGLWEMTPGGGAVQREVSNVTGDSFAFTGPLPASFGLTVGTAGDPTLFGPDFRSLALSAASLPTDGPLGVEVVLCPTVRLEQSDLARLAAAFTPLPTSHFGDLGLEVELSVQTVAATLSDAGIVARVSGQMVVKTLGLHESGVFSASATLSAAPTTVPGVTDPVDLVTVSDLQVALPGFAGGVADAAVTLIRGYLTHQLTDQLRAFLRAELPAAVSQTFVLAALPPDVVVSVRNLTIDAAALQFRPALGALGTTLSTFTPPAIPPP